MNEVSSISTVVRSDTFPVTFDAVSTISVAERRIVMLIRVACLGLIAILSQLLCCRTTAAEPTVWGSADSEPVFSLASEARPFDGSEFPYQSDLILSDTPPPSERKQTMFPISASLGFVGGDDLSITRTKVGFSMPIYVQPGEGTDRPKTIVLASADFGTSFLEGQTQLHLPDQLYIAGGGLRAIRHVNDQWNLIGGINVNYQGDGKATEDVVNVSGMAMLQWARDDQTQWTFGAVATGLDDLPVLPIVGVSWKPTEDWEISLGLPQTRIAHRVDWFGPQHDTWFYVGLAGVGGGSYAVRHSNGMDDQLTINEFPIVFGLEQRGDRAQWYLEAGVVVGRELEYELTGERENLGAGFFTSAGLKF